MVCAEARSDWIVVPSGVPQGSVLGPFLFAALLDDLRLFSPNATYLKFADDATVVVAMRRAEEDTSQNELTHIEGWSEGHLMLLHT